MRSSSGIITWAGTWGCGASGTSTRPVRVSDIAADLAAQGVRPVRLVSLGGPQQLEDLVGVQHASPPVEPDPPPRERPAEHLGERGHDALAVAEQQQREG